jgi:uncharacterized protein (TIGR02996 family)
MGREDEARGLLEAIRESPEDDTPRLLYADWLDDHGSPLTEGRPEFIRAQIELTRLTKDDPRRAQLEKRASELLAAHRAAWLGPLAKVMRYKQCTFRRGFPNDLAVRPKAMVEHAAEFDLRVPAGRVTLYGGFAAPALKSLAACPRLGWVAGLNWEHAPLEDGGLGIVAGSPNLPRLAELSVYGKLTTAGVQALADSPHLGALRRLSLRFSFGTGAPLATASALSSPGAVFRLRALVLTNLPIGPEGAEALAGAAHLGELKELALGSGRIGIGDRGAAALARSPHLRGLSRLLLSGNELTADAIRALADSPLLDGIRELSLAVNDLGNEGVAALAACPRLATLESLNLNRVGLTDRGAEALANSPHLANLTDLSIVVNRITDRGSQALFDSPHLRRLERIHIGEAAVRDKIISPAQRKQWLQRLGKGARV